MKPAGNEMDSLEDLVKGRFGTAVAKELCRIPGLFEQGRLYRRTEIVETLRDEFVSRGGDERTQNDDVARVLKNWLRGPASPFRNEAWGRYRFRGLDGATEQALDLSAPGGAGSDAAPEIEDIIADAFKDVTADDWARLPEDLCERLDYYLYEDRRP